MKTARLFLTIAGLVLANCVMADDFYVADFSIAQGETKTISIELNNSENEYIAFEFYMSLPEGVTIAEDEYGDLMAILNSGRSSRHILEVVRMNNGNYHFLCYSNSNTKFKGTTGEIISLTVTASETATIGSGLEGRLYTQKLSDPNKHKVEFDDYVFHVDITGTGGSEGMCPHGSLIGDLSGDNYLTVTDVMLLVNEFIGVTGGQHVMCPQGCLLGDMDSDGIITVTDVMVLVNKIVGN